MSDQPIIGHYELDQKLIADHTIKHLRVGKRITHYKSYFDGLDDHNFDINVIGSRLLFGKGKFAGRLEVSLEALNNKWIAEGEVKQTNDLKYVLQSIKLIRCISPVACHATAHGGRRRFHTALITKYHFSCHQILKDVNYAMCCEATHHRGRDSAVAQYILARTKDKLPLNCDDCRHKMTCLVAPATKITFEPVTQCEGSKPK